MDSNLSYEVLNIINKAKEVCNSSPNAAIQMLEGLGSKCDENNYTLGKAHCYLNLSLMYKASSDTKCWIDTAYKGLELFMLLEDKDGMACSLNSLGSACVHAGNYEDALLNFLQAQEMNNSQEIVNEELAIRILNNIGEVYRQTLQYDKSYECYEQALEKSRACNYTFAYSNILTNLGLALISESRFKDAKINFENSYSLALKLKDTLLLGEIETQLGFIYYQENNFDKAMEYYNNALNKLTSINNTYYLIDLLIKIGRLKLEANAPDALSYFNNAIDLSLATNNYNNLALSYDILYKYFEEKDNYNIALHYHKKYHEVTENIATKSLSTKLEILKINVKNNELKTDLDEIIGINNKLKTEVINQNKKIKSIEEENSTLRFRAFHDELTSLPNRYAISNKVNFYWENSSLKNTSLLCLLIDIDNFKKYNDFWGHPQGDRCLVTISKCLHQFCVENNCFCGRYGGEEFIFLSENISYKRGIQLGNELRKRVKGLNIRYGDAFDSPSVTISIGGVYGPIDALKSYQNMLDVADKQLYKSKNSGRDNLNIVPAKINTAKGLTAINEIAIDAN